VVKEAEKKERSKGKASPLEEKIKEDKALKKMDRGQLNKWKNTPMDDLEHLAGKEGRTGWRSP
jgi:hypothetical protein